jgi:anti-sigma28 factor (negative regulator of flagellin synthesis)
LVDKERVIMTELTSIQTMGLSRLAGVGAAGEAGRATGAQGTSSARRQSDAVEVSPVAQARAAELSGVRWDKVKAARELIAKGAYETPERLEATIDALLKDLRA